MPFTFFSTTLELSNLNDLTDVEELRSQLVVAIGHALVDLGQESAGVTMSRIETDDLEDEFDEDEDEDEDEDAEFRA